MDDAAGICASCFKQVDCEHRPGADCATPIGAAFEPFMKSGIDTTGLSLLQHKRIYFGHQSVGENILQGVQALLPNGSGLRLRIVECHDPSTFTEPALHHSRVGRNREPRSKVDDFISRLAGGIGERTDLALLKFCYVDVVEHTDVDALFSYYRDAMAHTAARFPQARLIHVTVPVTVMPGRWRRLIGILRRRKNRAACDNLARTEYNRLMIQHYAGREPIFDLATTESTMPHGRLLEHNYQGQRLNSLVPAYSSDGGHLSESGRRFVAARFLDSLASAAANRTELDRPSTHD